MTMEKSDISDPAINEAAAVWYLTVSSRDVTNRERRAFKKWLKKSTEHELAFRNIEAFWSAKDKLKSRLEREGDDLAVRVNHLVERSYQRLPRSRSTAGFHYFRKLMPIFRQKWVVGGGGVAIAASLAVAAMFGDWSPSPPASNVFETATGQHLAVTLADKSIVHLNTQSRVAILYSGKERHIRLERGEAVFSVAKNPARPFVVETTAGRVTALGTVFGVRIQKEKAKVIVLEGVVRVDGAGEAAGTDAHRAAKWKSELVHVNQTAEINKTVQPVATLTKDAVGRAVSWREGRLEYLEEPLVNVVADLNRYRKDKVVIADKSIGNTAIGGLFHTSDTDFLLLVLQSEYGVKVVHVTPYLTLLFKAA